MLRCLPALLALLLVVPAAASAAPFGELPFQPANGSAACLRATGAPGELLRQTETTLLFLTGGAAGLTAGGVLASDGAVDCAGVAGWPGGGSVLAFPVISESDGEVWMRGFLRDPGRSWGEPIDILPPQTRLHAASSAVAASVRGDALVAESSVDARDRLTVRVARRVPGGAFGAPERLADGRTAAEDSADLRAGFSASGEAVVAWSAKGPDEREPPDLWVAIAPPSAPFGTPQRIAPADEDDGYALAVGADGRALLVLVSGERLVAAERAPGGAFGAPSTLAETSDPLGISPVAVLRAGGGAIVAWSSPSTAALEVRTRETAGAFGPAAALVRPKRLDAAALRVQRRFARSTRQELVRAAATPDGRAVITWGHLSRRQGLWRSVPGVALVGFAGGERETHALGGALRDIDAVTSVVLADGTMAVAWTDNDADGDRGRIHLAREGSPDVADAPAPKVTFTPPRSRELKREEPLVLRVSCDAACDVLAQVAGRPELTASASLPAAGSRRLRLYPADEPVAPRGGGKVRLLLRSSAPGAHRATARTLTLNLRRAPIRFPPRVLGLTVTPEGDDLVVRWRTATRANPRRYMVWAFDDQLEPVGSGEPAGKAWRTSFTVRVRDARGASEVTIYALADDAEKARRTTVEVPR